MNNADAGLLADIVGRIGAIAGGRPTSSLTIGPETGPEVRAVAEAVNGLIGEFALLRDLSVALANGSLDFEVPPKHHLVDPLKSLQASLRHLTWQTQEVAAGNLMHRVDFLGEFSDAFNRMVEALSEKRRAEREAMQMARLASVGQLAAGIAHEINTPVQYIGDNLQYIDRGVAKLTAVVDAAIPLAAEAAGSEAASRFDEAVAAARLTKLMGELPAAVSESLDGVAHISRIVMSMKDFSHPGTTHKTTTDLNRALESTLTVSRNAWKHAAEVVCALDPELPAVVCHAGEINQVFLNLTLNAAQAIEASGKPLPGRIDISTRRDGDWVEIVFADSGTGVPAALRQQIFEPFFTTKPVGKGTGQGLAICRDVIVRRHGGTLEVGGAEGEGAVFALRLPIGGGGEQPQGDEP